MFAGRRRLARIDRHLDRGDELMESVRDELRLTREMHERSYGLQERSYELNERSYELLRQGFGEVGRELGEIRQGFGEVGRELGEIRQGFGEVGRELELTRAELRRQHEANLEMNRREHELNRREHRQTRSAVNGLRDTTRTLVVEVGENTAILRDLREESRAQTACLMRILDVLRRLGPGEEPLAS